MHRLRVIGLTRQDLKIEFLSLSKIAGLMTLLGKLKCLVGFRFLTPQLG